VSEYVHKQRNVSVLLYHLVCPAKYRRVVFTEDVDSVLKEVCLEIAKRYEIVFIEIGVEKDHVHFLLQSVPSYSPTRIARMIKSITAREIFKRVPAVKRQLWGGEFWTKGYFMSTVGRHGNEDTIKNYVKNQGRTEKGYKQLHRQELQLDLFCSFDTP
jgi:putative transposase